MEVKCFTRESRYNSKNSTSKQTISTFGRLWSWLVVVFFLPFFKLLASVMRSDENLFLLVATNNYVHPCSLCPF